MMKKIIVGLFACSIFLVSLLRTDLFVDPFLTPKALFVQVLIGVLFVISLEPILSRFPLFDGTLLSTIDLLYEILVQTENNKDKLGQHQSQTPIPNKSLFQLG